MKSVFTFLALVGLAWGTLVPQAQAQGAPAAAPAVPAQPDAAAGKAKYDVFCATCHGPTGTGDGPAAAALNPKPRNHQDPVFQKSKTDADIAKVIKEGGAAVGLSPTMPPWGASLTDADIRNIVAYIRQLGKSAAK